MPGMRTMIPHNCESVGAKFSAECPSGMALFGRSLAFGTCSSLQGGESKHLLIRQHDTAAGLQ